MEHRDLRRGAIVIFGGASGIGLAVARLGADIYSSVVIADIHEGQAGIDIVAAGRAQSRRCDASDPRQVKHLLAEVRKESGMLAAVVTTVGGARLADPLALDLDGWRSQITFNLDTAYVVATAAAGIMVEQGEGAIVTTASTYANVPRPDRIAYTAAKAGVIAFTRSLAMAVAGKGVRVNCVAPGSTDTPRLRAMTGEGKAWEDKLNSTPQGRIASTDDVARVILYLASADAASVAGQVLWVNNGAYMP
ncbi:MAG TPA: SDR family oxidoreductase [Ramlibacter sp.]|uniref:SDR family NAD(P)-dependent oxidoreductase n=1 Tax=Ramlibacter sp. TaxID=1917967 RepID=UPI002BB0B28B|nr:SDR family oxidoreductase [Ramlibacter sp.]HVZ46540.1 SDR family oxidoreductase [Ramlibacter sp.]